jgi:DNA-directed RNA polymerase subunit RPC12/RpoP
MSEGMSRGAIVENDAEISPAKERIQCRMCGSEEVRRAFRRGYLQLNIFPLFGYYPWRCMTCGTRMMLRKRHRKKQDHAE